MEPEVWHIINSHSAEISQIKTIMYPIEGKIQALTVQTDIIAKNVEKLTATMDVVKEGMSGIINRDIGKEAAFTLLGNRLKLIISVFTIISALIGYFSYEVGLIKPNAYYLKKHYHKEQTKQMA